MRIRSKLVAALVVPLVALVALSWVAISASSETADEASERAEMTRAQVALGTATIGPAGVITAIQAERNIAVAVVAGYGGALQADQTLDGSRADTDAALEGFRAAITSGETEVREAYESALQALGRIADIRDGTDSLMAERAATGADPVGEVEASENSEIFDAYTDILLTVFDVNTEVVLSLDDQELRGGAHFVNELGRANELQARLMRYVGMPLATGETLVQDTASLIAASRADGELTAIQKELRTSGPANYRAMADATFDDPKLQPSINTVETAMAGIPLTVDDLVSNEVVAWSGVYDTHRNTASAELAIHAERLISEAESERDSAQTRVQVVTIGTGLVLLLAVAIALLASRSIAQPLRRLASDAEDMAASRLPEAVQDILNAPLGDDVHMPELAPVSSEGGAEIGELASALNTVQSSAVDLAVEQAILRRNISDSFVNLGRRNQNLLSRQLDSITEMEREETDPDELQKLFALDHLATRMRRNAESLLLLAGLEPHRQWSAPVPLIDVIRGALGEVEDYSRVEIARFDEALVSGSAAADLTHMVAELLENALNFSPPGRNVTIAGARRDHGYMLAIVDNGIGMEADAVAQANVRLAGGESFTVAPSRYLGHYVVGIQAARLGTPVSLQDTPTGGVTAIIDITAALATDEAVPAALVDDASPGPEPLLDESEITLVGVAEDAPSNPSAQPATLAPFEEAASYTGAAPPVPTASPVPTGSPMSPQDATVSTPVERPRTSEVAPAPQPEPAPAPIASSAPNSANGPSAARATGEAPEQRTASGYKKRVRGSHAPRTDVISARRGGETETVTTEDSPSAADEMRSMLSGLQAGSERAEAEFRDQSRQRTEDQ